MASAGWHAEKSFKRVKTRALSNSFAAQKPGGETSLSLLK
jgi:hypothetical protein